MKLTVPVFNTSGKVVGEHEVSAAVFGVTGKPQVVQQAIVAEQANARQPLAHTKVRSEVRGGGKKPWKQKGTGQARHGSIRSPQWRGGGVIFGPRKDRNYAVGLNKKMKRKALLMTLTDKVARERLVILDSLEISGKTKDWNKAMKSIWAGVKSSKKNPSAIVMMPTLSAGLKQATKNVPRIDAIRTDSLNVLTMLKHDYAITTVDGVKALEKWLSKK